MHRMGVRMDDKIKQYIDDIFYSTSLDRNQFVRLAIFHSCFSEDFKKELSRYLKSGASLPSPNFSNDQERYWREQCPSDKEGGSGVSVNNGRRTPAQTDRPDTQPKRPIKQNRRIESQQGREGSVHKRTEERGSNGGITIRIG